MRKPLPTNLEKEILVRNRHCCCICQKDGIGKEVWIHHIDGNNSHNVANNLAVLCVFPHASQADAGLLKGKVGSGKKIKPDEVKEYKKIWEKKIEEENKIPKVVIPFHKRKQLELLYYFEIHKTKNEILSLDGNSKSIKEKFSFLNELVIEDFRSGIKIRKILSEAYGDIAVICIASSSELIKQLSNSILALLSHLAGPVYVPIDKEDSSLLRECIDNLKYIGEYVAEYNRASSNLKYVCSVITKLGEIVHWYKRDKEKKQIFVILNEIKIAANNFEKNKKTSARERVARIKIINDATIKLKQMLR